MDIIKVKIMDEDGGAKGRAYTYKSEVDVNVGDLVVADMAGHDKVLQVVEVGVPQAEIDNLDYEIKTVKGLLPEGEEIPKTGEIKLKFEVLEESLPVVKINYDEIKAAISGALEKYKGIVVTEQTLSGCKATQKELAGVKNKIDTYRKEKKKELSAPITVFENQCKELIADIESIEKPIKDGIAVFDERKKEKKRQEAEEIRLEVVEETGLREKYAARLTIETKYYNLTAKKCDVRDDFEARALALKVEQDRADELTDIIKDAIVVENERLNKKMILDDFAVLIKTGAATKDILAEVRKRAQDIFDAEHPAPKPASVTEEKEPVAEPERNTYAQDSPIQPAPEDPECLVVCQTTGKLSQLHAMKAWVLSQGMTYKAVEQRRL